MVVTSRETPLGHYLSVAACSASVAADKGVFIVENYYSFFFALGSLDKIAEKREEYFYIKCKFDAEIGNLILSFGQDYFSLYGILEEIVARAGQKTEGFRVNITMEQKLRWEDAARKRDMTMSQMIREAVEMYIAVMKRQQELDKSKV